MEILSSNVIRRRAARRIINDLPEDLADMEEDDPIMVMILARPLLMQRQEKDRGKAPAERKARFAVPSSPASSRQRSLSGHQSFHFEIGKTRPGGASSYDSYASEGATLVDEGRPSAERQDNAGPSASHLDSYMSDHGGADGGASLQQTNLDPDPRVRASQWDRIEAHEFGLRKQAAGGTPRINIHYERSPDLLLKVAGDKRCPEGLRDLILKERDRAAAGVPLSPRKRSIGVGWVSDDALSAMAWIETLAEWSAQTGKDAPIKLSRGRGAVAVIRGELELPHLFDHSAVGAVMSGLQQFVQAQADEEDGLKCSFVPFMATPHFPGALNDARNVHVHLMHGTRSVSQGGDGDLTFAKGKVASIGAMGWMKRLRCEAARLINVELERLGADFQLSPESYAKMGIHVAPQRKLDSSQIVLARASVPTGDSIANDAEAWQRQLLQAKQAQIDALFAMEERDRLCRARLEQVDGDARKKHDLARTAALEAERRAHQLRYEAAEIGIYVAMARSSAQRTARFAPAYADKARHADRRDSYDSAQWRRRGDEAIDFLAKLDAELTQEREAKAFCEREADRAMAEAGVCWAQVEQLMAVGDDRGSRMEKRAPPSPLRPAQAVQRIMALPLLVSSTQSGYIVQAADDPAGEVRGVDLTGHQPRLAGIYKAQQQELRQLVAFMRKHRLPTLSDEVLNGQDDWIRRIGERWRDSAALRRAVAAAHAARIQQQLFNQGDEDGPRDALSLTPGAAPSEIGSISEEELGKRGILLGPAPAAKIAFAAPAPSLSSAALSKEDELVAQDNDRRLRAERSQLAAQFQAAIQARAGDEHRLTAHGARLLGRILDGFDPATVDCSVGMKGRTLDQNDADEISVLARGPSFKALIDAAGKGDRAVRSMVQAALPKSDDVDLLARVRLIGKQINFSAPTGPKTDCRTPRHWLERCWDDASMMRLPLTQHEGMVGLFDRAMLTRTYDNVIGLAYPDVQAQLEALWRIQREQDETLLRQIQNGELMPKLTLETSWVGGTQSRVAIPGLAHDHPSMVRRRDNPAWYIACRKATLGIAELPSHRHDDPVVSAWLRARDEHAPSAVLDRLAQRLRERGEDLAIQKLGAADRKALGTLLAEAAVQRVSSIKVGVGPEQHDRGR